MRAARVMAIALAAAAAVAGAVVSVALGRGEPGEADRLAILLVVVTYVVVAVVILGARPGNPVGRLLLAGACAWGAGEGLLAVGVEGAVTVPGSVPAPVPTLVLIGVLGTAARGLGWLVLALWVPLVFPDGRTAWPGRRAPVVLVAAAVGTFTLATLLSPTPLESRLEDLANPIGLPDDWRLLTDLMAIGALGLAVASLGVAVAGLVRRWRGGDEMVHQQLLWFAAAFACPLLLLPLVATPGAAPWMFAVVSLPVPVAVGVALLQRRLYDIQLVVSRTLTYLLLSAAVAALYALTVGGVGVLLRERGAPWLPWVAAGVVAVSFAPLRNALQQMVTRLTYGQWSEPASVLAASGRRLADAADVPALLRSLVAELGEGLGLERVEILDAHGRTLARHGADDVPGPAVAEGVPRSAVADGVELPLLAYGVRVGVLRHSPCRLRAADRELLADVARQLGGVVHSAALLETIREGQERLVLAREEERRRLRRDLHDGLGPALAALTLQVDTLRNRLASAGVAAGVGAGVPAGVAAPAPVGAGAGLGDGVPAVDVEAELLRLRGGIQSTVRDVRRVVEGLRPPALDEHGVDGALRQLARHLAAEAGLAAEVEVEVNVELPAAVEVAVYRVAQEALTNVVRHAGATRVAVTLRAEEGVVVLEVCDDGCGTSPARVGGVGQLSMRERAEEIGGSLRVEAVPGRGTTVLMRLPVAAP